MEHAENDTDGDFTLTYAGQTTIRLVMTAAPSRCAARSLDNVGAVAVTRAAITDTANPKHGYLWFVTFSQDVGNAENSLLTMDSSGVRASRAPPERSGAIATGFVPVATRLVIASASLSRKPCA